MWSLPIKLISYPDADIFDSLNNARRRQNYRMATTLYSNQAAFLDALSPFDTAALNELLGPIYDACSRGEEDATRTNIIVWDQGKPILVFSGHAGSNGQLATCMPQEEWSGLGPFVDCLQAELKRTKFKPLSSLFGPKGLLDLYVGKVATARESMELYRLVQCPVPSEGSNEMRISRVGLTELSEEDRRDLLALRAGYFAHGAIPDSFSDRQAASMLERAFDIGAIWTCKMDSRTVGYLYTARPTFQTVQVRQFYVGEQWRGNGAGRALLHFVCRAYLSDTASNQQAKVGSMDVAETKWGRRNEICVLADNENAIRLYKGMGFELVGEYCSIRL